MPSRISGRIDDGMAALRRDYVAKLRITLAGLELDLEAWCAGDAEAGSRLRRAGHRLYGSGATYGFPALTEAAEKVEEMARTPAPDMAAIRALRALIGVARGITEGPPD